MSRRVHLVHVHTRTMVDAISLSTVATYDIQVAFSIELRALLRESHSLEALWRGPGGSRPQSFGTTRARREACGRLLTNALRARRGKHRLGHLSCHADAPFSAPNTISKSEPKMLRPRLGQARNLSGLPILANQAHSADIGTKSRDYI